MIKNTIVENTFRVCPESEQCQVKNSFKNILLFEPPANLILNLVWGGFNPPIISIFNIFEMISQQINMQEMLPEGPFFIYTLKGIICFYGAHYVAFFKKQQMLSNAQDP